MAKFSIARIKCYILLEGLERSLAEILKRSYPINEPGFFNSNERSKALNRFREDVGETGLETKDLDGDSIISYLDLGDLIQLLQRNLALARELDNNQVKAVTKYISEQGTIPIRKRVMHPVRPLELDDLTNLLKIANSIPSIAPSLKWDSLEINLRKLANDKVLLDLDIPIYQDDEIPIPHNLPVAEFDDTGFIGRHAEQRHLENLLRSDHRVITIVGEGGKGKTALALKVCHNLIESNEIPFDRFVWVTLKTKYLTHEGIRQIKDAIDSLGALIDNLLKNMDCQIDEPTVLGWDRIIEQMKVTKTLLVIDNLETLDSGIRELAIEIPSGSKVLFTSRIGLGEIEVRYELPDFPMKDANHLFRSLVDIHNCTVFKNIKSELVNEYCEKLHNTPLLIKWFVLAVMSGSDPQVLLSKEGLADLTPVN